MTSPALLVLLLAHVCSTFGTVSGHAADHDKKLIDTQTMGFNAAYARLSRWTNIHKDSQSNNKFEENNNVIYKDELINKIGVKYDEIYEGESDSNVYDISKTKLDKSSMSNNGYTNMRIFDQTTINKRKHSVFRNKLIGDKRIKRDATEEDKCAFFKEIDGIVQHPHPMDKKNTTYYRNVNCVTVIEAEKNQVIELTFIDQFEIEYHKDCNYDFLEIRDGKLGYARPLGRLCGDSFPQMIQTSGPYAWLKFKSDDTIEYNGFKIQVTKKAGPGGSPPEPCFLKEIGNRHGVLSIKAAEEKCEYEDEDALDILWYVETPSNTKILLNFTKFNLQVPNECEVNIVEVFGSHAETESRLAQYCGSIANSVTTKDEKEIPNEKGYMMYVRVYVAPSSREKTEFQATYIAFRTLNPNNVADKCHADEFDCDDNTCIAIDLHCNEDGEAHCRLKTDEDPEDCLAPAATTINQPHILVILVIFSLILSAMSFVFLYKCIKKLVEDHKIIKEHIRESCEDRLDAISGRLTLDANKLQRDSEPRASLERENRANEMYKRHRESFSKRKPSSIDSDYIQETHLDIDEEPWRRDVDSIPDTNDVRIERNGRTRHSQKEKQDRRNEKKTERRSDVSRKEESIRSRPEEVEKKEIRDASVGPPDTKDSGCQTRESLFQTDPPPSSDGSGTTGTNSRGFSTFGYSGATIARPSPPTNTSEITIELLRQVPRQDTVKPHKKLPDRRPISAETTRSAPDVIIVSKPIR